MPISAEQWLPVVGFEGAYEVSDLGRVRSLARVVIRSNGIRQSVSQRVLKHHIGSNGYPSIALHRGGQTTHLIHVLVLTAFVGPRPIDNRCRHLDGDKLNSRLSNLAWGTCSENELDKAVHGTHCRGPHHWNWKGGKYANFH